jgi:hypothetical protein
MKDPKNIIILSLLLLLLISGGLNLFQNSLRKNDKIRADLKEISLLNENAVHKANSDSAKAQESRTRAKIDSERASFKVALSKAEAEITRHKSNSAATRPKIQVLVDSIPDLRDFVAFQDSTIASQDTLITGLQLRHNAEVIDLNEIIKLQGQQIVSNMAIGENWRQMAENAQAGERREMKKKKFWRFLAGVGIATAGVLAITGQ